jgi:serine/threonine-protein kinase
MGAGPDDEEAYAATLAASHTPRASAGLEVGELVDRRFTVERLLGEGTFGWVYAARAPSGETVALKVLRPEHASDSAVVARFKRRELELLLRIHAAGRQPNVVAAVEPHLIAHAGLLVLVLQFIEGIALDELIRQERMLDEQEARRIAVGIAQGLAAIHAVDGVHRDLKPANVRVRPDGTPVILDLGIARAMWETQTLTGTGQYLMTPLYAAPEQLAGGQVGPASDVYALGLILYEMLTGSVPLTGRTYAETLTARTTRTPPDPRTTGRAIDKAMVTSLLGTLVREPGKRPTPAELVAALSRPTTRRKGGRRALLGGGIAVVVAAGVIAAIALHKAPPSPGAAPAASIASPASPPVALLKAEVGTPAPVAAPTAAAIGIALDAPRSLVAGHDLVVRVTVEQPAYVALVSVGADGKASLLVPDRGTRARSIEPGHPLIFPSAAVTPGVVHFRVALPAGARSTVETLHAVAARDAADHERLVREIRKVGAAALTNLAVPYEHATLQYEIRKSGPFAPKYGTFRFARRPEHDNQCHAARFHAAWTWVEHVGEPHRTPPVEKFGCRWGDSVYGLGRMICCP